MSSSVVSNWLKKYEETENQYDTFKGWVHGVQKDAIQNGWDARKSKDGKDWKFYFKLITKGKTKYFIQEDYGTTGLTGRVLNENDYQDELPENERLGRFLGDAFGKISESSIGNRGRGKSLFICSANEVDGTKRMFFDSVRDDGKYIFGWKEISRTKHVFDVFEDKIAELEFEKYFGKDLLLPLNHIGTRIIVQNPRSDLVKALNSGIFLKNISETWWEIINDFDAQIFVEINKVINKAKLPIEFPIEKKSDLYETYTKINLNLQKDELIEKLVIGYKANGINEEFKGISIQRGGMKILTLDPTSEVYHQNNFPKESTEGIYGYAKLSPKLEKSIKEAEGVEHYSYDFRMLQAKYVKLAIMYQVKIFCVEKLKLGEKEKKRISDKEKKMADEALFALNEIAKNLDLRSDEKGDMVKSGVNSERGINKEIRIETLKANYPEKNIRVNYGQIVKNIRTKIINESSSVVSSKFFLTILSQDFERSILEKEIIIEKNSTSDEICFAEIEFSKNQFKKGKYTIKAQLVSLDKKTKGDILDTKTLPIFLEVDPPIGGIFGNYVLLDQPKDHKMGWAEMTSSKINLLNINIGHSAYKEALVEDQLKFYILLVGLSELTRFDVLQARSKIFDKKYVNDPNYVLMTAFENLGKNLSKIFTRD